MERRKEIYAICQKYDIIIIEDDPYWNLQYPSAGAMEARYRGTADTPQAPPDLYSRSYNASGKSSGYAYLDSLVPSYLSVDTDGRVVRVDTFSKTIAPGSRLGWVTGQPAVIERFSRVTESSTQQPSGFVQSLVAELILGPHAKEPASSTAATTAVAKQQQQQSSGWQMDGWVRWLDGLRNGYERRMQTICSTLEEGKYYVGERRSAAAAASSSSSSTPESWEVVDKALMYDFSWPQGGMFVWVTIHLETHPLFSRFPPEKLSHALWMQLLQKPFLCLCSPGALFSPTPETLRESWRFLRLSFAAAAAEDIGDISKRFVDGCHAFWQRTDLDGIDDDEVNAEALNRMRIYC